MFERKKIVMGFMLLVLFGSWGTNTYAQPSAQRQFIETIRESVQHVNEAVLQERTRIQQDLLTLQAHRTLDSKELSWLTNVADYYKLKSFNLDVDSDWQALLERVDVIPESLAIAQAIDESAWGTSRFARDANNLFGRWCFVKGCGIVPKNRVPGAKHEIKKFNSLYDSIKDYVHNLNSNDAYKALRQMRKVMRGKNGAVNGAILASGLLKYSSRGTAYVSDIKRIIKKYRL